MWRAGSCSGTVVFPVQDGAEPFFAFQERPYEELPEFQNNLVIGSAGVNYTYNGLPKTFQKIFRIDFGHLNSNNSNPHINQDEAKFIECTTERYRDSAEENHLIPLSDSFWAKLVWKDTGQVIGESRVRLPRLNINES